MKSVEGGSVGKMECCHRIENRNIDPPKQFPKEHKILKIIKLG